MKVFLSCLVLSLFAVLSCPGGDLLAPGSQTKRYVLEPYPDWDSGQFFEKNRNHTVKTSPPPDRSRLNGKDFGVSDLKRLGFYPRRRLVFEGREFLLTDLVFPMGRGRLATVAYVRRDAKEGEKAEYVPRLYYTSNSGALWRYLPNVLISRKAAETLDWDALALMESPAWYNKGWGEDSENLPFFVQRVLADPRRASGTPRKLQLPEDKNAEQTVERIVAGVAGKFHSLAMDSFARGTYYKGSKAGGVTQKFVKISQAPHDTRILPPPESLIPENHENHPDFKAPFLEYRDQSELYGEFTVRSFYSSNKELLYTFATDSQNRVWIPSIEILGSPVTELGLRQKWVRDALLTPLYEYEQQAGVYGNRAEVHRGHYVEMWSRYQSQIPMIRNFRVSVLQLSNPPLIQRVKPPSPAAPAKKRESSPFAAFTLAKEEKERANVILSVTGDEAFSLRITLANGTTEERPWDPSQKPVLTLGRFPANGIQILLRQISKDHAVLKAERQRDGGWQVTLTDLGSSNGTYVDGQRIESFTWTVAPQSATPLQASPGGVEPYPVSQSPLNEAEWNLYGTLGLMNDSSRKPLLDGQTSSKPYRVVSNWPVKKKEPFFESGHDSKNEAIFYARQRVLEKVQKLVEGSEASFPLSMTKNFALLVYWNPDTRELLFGGFLDLPPSSVLLGRLLHSAGNELNARLMIGNAVVGTFSLKTALQDFFRRMSVPERDQWLQVKPPKPVEDVLRAA